MSSIAFKLCYLGYIIGQGLTFYIVSTYCFVVLPTSDVPWWIIGLNYIIHLTFVFMQQFSYWMVNINDPGYFKSFYEVEQLEEENQFQVRYRGDAIGTTSDLESNLIAQ
jgi:hypothetical protein